MSAIDPKDVKELKKMIRELHRDCREEFSDITGQWEEINNYTNKPHDFKHETRESFDSLIAYLEVLEDRVKELENKIH